MADEQSEQEKKAQEELAQQNSQEQDAQEQDPEEAAPCEPEVSADDEDEVDLEEQITKLNDQLLRSFAEVENVKRRALKDVENAHKFAVERLLNDLFPVLDSLEKAEETAATTEGAQPIAQGVALSLKLFVETLARSGVEQIDPLGEPFDPQHHEALAMVPNPDAQPNTVMEVMAKGYVLNGRLVRAAKVIVVQG